MILYCHICYIDGDWVEDISGENYIQAVNLSETEYGSGDVVYIGY